MGVTQMSWFINNPFYIYIYTYVKIRQVKFGGLRLRVFSNEMDKSRGKVFQAKLGGYVFAIYTYVKIRQVKLDGLRLRVFSNETDKSRRTVFQAKLGGYVFECF